MTEFRVNSRSLNSFDEDEYWVRIMTGDKSALEGLFSLFAYELMAFGMSVHPDRDLVKDCIQDLFIDIWKYRNNTRKVNNVKMYIFRSLSNKIKKEISRTIKRKQNEHLIGYDALYTEGYCKGGDDEFFIEEKDSSRLKAALNSLPTRQKEVITHVFFENLSHKQIAQIMGITVQSVYTLTWKAIGNLRKYITLVLSFLLLR